MRPRCKSSASQHFTLLACLDYLASELCWPGAKAQRAARRDVPLLALMTWRGPFGGGHARSRIEDGWEWKI